jgi:Protein of unknown function (DUF1580)
MAQATLTGEKPLTLAEAARLLPKRPNPATLWRWRTKGVRGVKLETLLIGGRRYVSRVALQQFIDAVTSAASRTEESPAASKPSNETKRQRPAETSRRLRQAGLIN